MSWGRRADIQSSIFHIVLPAGFPAVPGHSSCLPILDLFLLPEWGRRCFPRVLDHQYDLAHFHRRLLLHCRARRQASLAPCGRSHHGAMHFIDRYRRHDQRRKERDGVGLASSGMGGGIRFISRTTR